MSKIVTLLGTQGIDSSVELFPQTLFKAVRDASSNKTLDQLRINWDAAYNWGDHSQAGYAVGVKIGDSSYDCSNGYIILPTHLSKDVPDWALDTSKPIYDYSEIKNTPTELPASDVHDWAKDASKPSYDYSEIKNTPASLPASDVPAWAKDASKPSYDYSEIKNTPASLPASDVPAWAKDASKPSYDYSEIKNTPTELPASDVHDWAKDASKPTYDYSEIKNTPDSLPASDVPAWAKDASKPSYDYSEIKNTPDSLPASDVHEWAKDASKPSYDYSEIKNTPASLPASDVPAWAKDASKPTYDYSEIKNTPTSLPASDVHDWAKDASKPTYDYSEIQNTPDIPDSSTVSGWGFLKNVDPVNVVDSDASLAFGERSKIGSVNGTDLHVSLPSLPYIAEDASITIIDKDASLAWGERTIIGVVNEVDLHVTLPSLPHIPDDSSVIDSDASLPWGARTKIAVVDGTEIHVTMPAKPNIPTTLAELTGDENHSLVKESDISNWNKVYDAVPAAAYNNGNELADKAFVNSTVQTSTASFKDNHNILGDLNLTMSATRADIAAALLNVISGADANDYCFVEIPVSADSSTQISRVERYKYNDSSWHYEYTLNNSSFTANQWAAINSGITDSLISEFDGKYKKPINGIPDTDLTEEVQTLLGKAGTALQSHQSVIDSDASLTYGSRTKIGTVGNTDFHITLPALPHIPNDTTVTDSDASLSWGTRKKIGTINNVDLHVTLPSLPYIPEDTSILDNDASLAYGERTEIARVNNVPIHVRMPESTGGGGGTSSHRIIKVNGSTILGDNDTPLNLVAGSNVTLDSSGNQVIISSTGGGGGNDSSSGSPDLEIETFYGNVLTAVVGKYYRTSSTINLLDVVLPIVSDTTKTKSIIIRFTTGSTPAISFTSADSKTISYYNNYNISAGNEYEINILFDGVGWVVASSQIGGMQGLSGSPEAEIVEFSGTTLSPGLNKYYDASTDIGSLAVTLPAVGGSITKCIMIHLTTTSSPSITYTSSDSKTISYYSSYAIEASKEYEISIMFNGTKWIIASAEITTT